MTKHFRLELNIGQEKPLHKIMEDKREEDDLISETDPRDKFPITEAEKPKIEHTRVQVTSWFPVWVGWAAFLALIKVKFLDFQIVKDRVCLWLNLL